jgi:hypothetical protein
VRSLNGEVEREAITDALEKTRWRPKDAAHILGISTRALRYRMHRVNLDSGRDSRSQQTSSFDETNGSFAFAMETETDCSQIP